MIYQTLARVEKYKLGLSPISVNNSSPPGQTICHFTDIFKDVFMNEKFCILIQISLKFFWGSDGQKVSICSGDGLAPNRGHVITWTNADPVQWCKYTALVTFQFMSDFLWSIFSWGKQLYDHLSLLQDYCPKFISQQVEFYTNQIELHPLNSASMQGKDMVGLIEDLHSLVCQCIHRFLFY